MKLIFLFCEKKKKQQYRIQNWKQYNKALCNHGSITFWFDQQAIESWLNHSRSGKRSKPRTYGDACLLCMLVLKNVYHLPQRATYGMVCSLLQLMKLDLPVPHPTILSRRASTLEVTLPRQKINQPLHVLIDATGLKVYGEGEWKVRQHGYSKRRTWRKLHLAVEARSGEILAAVATTNHLGDKQVMCDLLDQVEEKITKVTADGGYDYATCYEEIAKRKKNKYHRRSLVETGFCRIKTNFGEKLSARKCESQAAEMFVRWAALNRMTHSGMPESYAL